MAVLPNLGASSFLTGERVGAGHSVRVAQRLWKYLPQINALWAKLAGGAALDTFNKPDPTVVRALTEASLANEAFGFIMIALFLAAVSYAILATGVFNIMGGTHLILKTGPAFRFSMNE